MLHLCQVNVARLKYGLEDSRLVGFSLAARIIRRATADAPGHVWSEQTDDGVSLFITRSVWESIAELEDFVYSGVHVRYMNRRSEWFIPSEGPNLALWWAPAGETPTIEEALSRLDSLRMHGPTAEVFDLS